MNAVSAKKFFRYDRKTGDLFWKIRKAARIKTDVPIRAKGRNGYVVTFKYKMYRVSRLIWLLETGANPTGQIDHIDGDHFNNKLENLRDVSSSENNRNRKRGKNNKSGFLGVCWYTARKKWRAQIDVNGKRFLIGDFKKIEDAVEAREKAVEKFGYHENHGRDPI